MNTIPTFLLLGLVLLLLIAPFSVFAPLVLLIVASVMVTMIWSFVRTLATGAANQPDE